MAEYDTSEVSRSAGVSSRTLRHYDAIGLLPPARTAPDGRRFYTSTELGRLQHILVLRSLGVPLERIAVIVDTDDLASRATLLGEHLIALEAERDRFARLAATVRRTITSLEKGQDMSPDQMFDGFDHEHYEPEARERWGDHVINRSNAAWKALGADGQKGHLEEAKSHTLALADAMKRGLDPADAEVQEAIERHHAWVSLFWVPGREAYEGLADMYVADPRFAANYEKVAEGLAAFTRDAIHVFAEARLA